jgi:hypothetical protein
LLPATPKRRTDRVPERFSHDNDPRLVAHHKRRLRGGRSYTTYSPLNAVQGRCTWVTRPTSHCGSVTRGCLDGISPVLMTSSSSSSVRLSSSELMFCTAICCFGLPSRRSKMACIAATEPIAVSQGESVPHTCTFGTPEPLISDRLKSAVCALHLRSDFGTRQQVAIGRQQYGDLLRSVLSIPIHFAARPSRFHRFGDPRPCGSTHLAPAAALVCGWSRRPF